MLYVVKVTGDVGFMGWEAGVFCHVFFILYIFLFQSLQLQDVDREFSYFGVVARYCRESLQSLFSS